MKLPGPRPFTSRFIPGRLGKSIIGLMLSFLGGAILLGAWCAQSVFQPMYASQRVYLERTQMMNEINQAELATWKNLVVRCQNEGPMRASVLGTILYEYCRLSDKMLANEGTRLTLGRNSNLLQVKDFNQKGLSSALSLVVRCDTESARAAYTQFCESESFSDFDAYADAMVKKAEKIDDARRFLESTVLPADLSDKEQREVKLGLLYLRIQADHVSAARSLLSQPLDDRYSKLLRESQESERRWTKWYVFAYGFGTLLIALRWVAVYVLLWPDKLAARDGTVNLEDGKTPCTKPAQRGQRR